MKEDKLVIAVCNPSDARKLLKDNPDMKDSIVETNLMPVGQAVVVEKDELLQWLYEHEV